jgi:N-sulfoglucosamine sulfohydrolase
MAGRGVVALIGDDHGLELGCYGNPVVATPNLDRLARRGTRFTHAFCTTASCSASRSVILTGLHNHASGQYGHAHRPTNFHTFESVESLPRLARAAGVVTGVVGKLHVQPATVYPWDFEWPGGLTGATRDVHGMAQAAGRFLKQAGGRSFYLHVGFSDPHRTGPGFGNDRNYPNVRQRKYSPADVVVPEFLPDRPEVRQDLAGYYEAVDRLDQGVGFLLEELEKSGRAKDTLIVYLGDNGMPFPGAKASFYDSGHRLPLLVSSPAQRARGVVNRAMVSFTDIAPTAMDWLGIPGPKLPMHGRSIVPILEQDAPGGWDEVYFSHTFHGITNYYPYRAIRTRTHKYIRFLHPELEMPLPSDLAASPTWKAIREHGDTALGRRRLSAVLRHSGEELYDLRKDPLETTDAAAAPEDAALLAELRAKVESFRKRTRDPWLARDQ